jgi:hypothetical protein
MQSLTDRRGEGGVALHLVTEKGAAAVQRRQDLGHVPVDLGQRLSCLQELDETLVRLNDPPCRGMRRVDFALGGDHHDPDRMVWRVRIQT